MSSRLHRDQPQGHTESKGLFTRCALHPKRDLFRGTEPGPRLELRPKAAAGRGRPILPLAPILRRVGPGSTGFEGAPALPATILPRAGATSGRALRGQRQSRAKRSFQKPGLPALSAARGRAAFPRPSAAARLRTPTWIRPLDSSFSHHACPSSSKMAAGHFRRVSLRGRPGDCLRSQLAGSSLFAA